MIWLREFCLVTFDKKGPHFDLHYSPTLEINQDDDNDDESESAIAGKVHFCSFYEISI